MKTAIHSVEDPEALPREFIDLLLDEAERALIDVENRSAPEPEDDLDEPADIRELRRASASLAEAFPGLQYDLETIGDRLRSVGAAAASQQLETHPHVVHLVRLSLEIFFRTFPTPEAYAADRTECAVLGEDDGTPEEMFASYAQLLELCRARLS